LTEEEKDRLLSIIQNERDRMLFILLAYTGLRVSEVTKLNVGDVKNQDLLTVNGKGQKLREVPIDGLRSQIESFLQQRYFRSYPLGPFYPMS
jgi:site-specific recombinase XerD